MVLVCRILLIDYTFIKKTYNWFLTCYCRCLGCVVVACMLLRPADVANVVLKVESFSKALIQLSRRFGCLV